jgi:predicted nucleic acid-binding protein
VTEPADVVVAVDTSVALPLILRSHDSFQIVNAAMRGHRARLTGHSLAESYAVLTRLPGDGRLSPTDAARLIDSNFGDPVTLSDRATCDLHRTLSQLRISGGAVYDALVGLTAREHGLKLITRDVRALGTYALLGVDTQVIG